MQLNTFIADYVPLEIRQGRAFVGNRGWVHLGNQIIRRLESEGFLQRDRAVEYPVLPDTKRNQYITIPTDMQRAVEIFPFSNRNDKRDFEIINGEIRLLEEYDDCESQVHAASEIYNTGTVATTKSCCVIYGTGVYTDDQFNDYVVKFHTLNELRIITDMVARAPTYDFYDLWWNEAVASAPTNASLVSIWSNPLILRYDKKYASLTAEDSEIPISDKFEEVMASGFCYLALSPSDKRRAIYKKEFNEAIDDLAAEVFTPSEEQARPQGREWPNFAETETEDDGEYIGE